MQGGQLQSRSYSVRPFKEKENQLMKLTEESNRVVVERVRAREEMEEDSMREKRKYLMMKAYEEKISN